MNTLEIEEALVYGDGISMNTANEFLQMRNRFVVLDFDVLQIPRYKIIYELKSVIGPG